MICDWVEDGLQLTFPNDSSLLYSLLMTSCVLSVTGCGSSRCRIVGLRAQRPGQRVVDRLNVRLGTDVTSASELCAEKLHDGVIGDRERYCNGVQSDVVVVTGEYHRTRATVVDRI